MKYGAKTLMVADVLVFTVGVQGVLVAPANGKAAVNKENVQAITSVRAGAVPGGTDNGTTKISINHANAEQLTQVLNGVGLKKAQATVGYRGGYRPFKTLDDLKQVPGMGNTLVERNLTHLTL